MQALIRRHTPDELGLPFALWNRAAVRSYLKAGFRLVRGSLTAAEVEMEATPAR